MSNSGTLRVLSLFSGCGGMDIGFEGGFIAPRRSFAPGDPLVSETLDDDWVRVRKLRFDTVFANDILPEAKTAWVEYMRRFGHAATVYREQSIVDLVKRHNSGESVFPDGVDVVLGGFPCQDFSVAGKRMGFDSMKGHDGKARKDDAPSEETRGKLYFWMKQVIDITRPKVFIAENVKGLTNLGGAKDIIKRDFASGGYIVLDPKVLKAGDYGVPETRERVIFIGLRADAISEAAMDGETLTAQFDPYPAKTHAYSAKAESLLPPVTTRDVLKGLKEPDEADDESQRVFSKAKYLANGSQGQTEIRLDGLGPTIRSEHHGNIEFRRLSAAHGGKHAEELGRGLCERRLTPRECALIQTFPPDQKFVMTRPGAMGRTLSQSGAYKVIGNAVPPVLAFKIAARLEEIWDKVFRPEGGL
ncbi:MAG: DNA cytosine methyltransferase [Marinilabiliaceae bacterium]